MLQVSRKLRNITSDSTLSRLAARDRCSSRGDFVRTHQRTLEGGTMKASLPVATAIVVATILAACGGGGGQYVSAGPFGDAAIPGITPTTNFSFDLGTVANGKYYLTDRNNKAVTAMDVNSLVVRQIT